MKVTYSLLWIAYSICQEWATYHGYMRKSRKKPLWTDSRTGKNSLLNLLHLYSYIYSYTEEFVNMSCRARSLIFFANVYETMLFKWDFSRISDFTTNNRFSLTSIEHITLTRNVLESAPRVQMKIECSTLLQGFSFHKV